ncbi:MAG: T9SS type A sorting domain-containing protein [Bacteroidales bacterium]|jgi:hypothetical protein
MKPKKILLLIASIFFLQIVGFSQEKELNINELKKKVENIPYVFKGEIIDVQYYFGDEQGNKLPDGKFHLPNGKLGYGFSSATIKICQIFKGAEKLKEGTIEIITKSSPNYMMFYVYPTEKGDSALGCLQGQFCTGCKLIEEPFIFLNQKKQNAIFFCTDAKYTGKTRFVFNNSLSIYPSSLGYIGINTNWIGNNMPVEDYKILVESEINDVHSTKEDITYAYRDGKRFYYPYDFYTFLKKLNLDTEAKDYCGEEEKRIEKLRNDSINKIKTDSVNKIRYQENLKKSNERMEQMIKIHKIDTTKTFEEWKKQQQNNTQKKIKKTRGDDLNLDIANSKLTGTDKNNAYLEFDILVYSYSYGYLDNCLIRLSYNNATFGSNIVANNNITITRGTAFNIPTYTDPNSDKADLTSSEINIPFSSVFNYPALNRTLLTSLPEVLVHIKIKIAVSGCGNYSDVDFAEKAFTPMFSFYTLNPNDSAQYAINFDNTYYGTGISDQMCMPIINSTFTNNVPAGNGSLLTITGKYFGEKKNTGTVIFKDADTSDVSYPVDLNDNPIGIDDYDTISWTDNKIVIKLPSTLEGQTKKSNRNPKPGSGLFKVKNFTTNSSETTTKITIPYALYQYIDIYPIYQKANINLSKQNDSGGYTIRCNTNINTFFPSAKPVINKAIHEWVCATGINWKLGTDTTTLDNPDGICTILSAVLPPDVLMSTSFTDVKTCLSSYPKKFYIRSFDISINSTKNWQIDSGGIDLQSGKYDFFQAIAHELGHGILLLHANQNNEVMFYASKAGYTIASNRIDIKHSTGAINGGRYEVDHYSSAIPSCDEGHIELSPKYCIGFSVKEINSKDIQISCFPNPIENGNLIVKLNLKKDSWAQFNLYNFMGQLVSSSNPQQIKKGEDIYKIPADELQAGMYYIQINFSDGFKTMKWIKL